MSRVSYINGSYKSHSETFIHIEDRGNQFSDGVYEVIPVRLSNTIDTEMHLNRLDKNLKELRINFSYSKKTLLFIFRRLIYLNKIKNGIIYLQVSRGIAKRDHAFPKNTVPTFFVTVRNQSINKELINKGVNVITSKDLRWGRCDIKTISLLPNVLAKQQAVENNAFETILIDDNSIINEGSSSNFWIIKQKKLLTGPITGKVLPGITRKVLKKIVTFENIEFSEEKFTLNDALNANEAMLTNSSNILVPVIKINNTFIGDGLPGKISLKLHKLLEKNISNQIFN